MSLDLDFVLLCLIHYFANLFFLDVFGFWNLESWTLGEDMIAYLVCILNH